MIALLPLAACGGGNRTEDGEAAPARKFDSFAEWRAGAGRAASASHQVVVIANEAPTNDQIRWLAPKKYHEPETSDLSVTIDGPTDDLEINLTWDGGEPFVELFESAGDIDPANP